MTDQYVQVQPNSTGLKVDTSELTVGANTVERQRMVVADPVYSAGLATVSPLGELNVAAEPRQLFYDTFDTGLNTIARWKTPVATGTGAIAATNVAGSGSTTLTGGTAANAYSLLESQPVFQSTAPGSLFATLYLAIETPVLTTGYRFWGFGVTPATPTVSAPLTDACGFEITTAGKLMAVTYAGGTRNQIADLSTSGTSKQPTDANPHKYLIWFKGDTMYWSIDTASNVVASTTGALGPVNHDLPIKFLAVSNSGTAETIVVDGVSVGDTGCNNTQISDGDYPWNQASVHDDGSVQVSTGQPFVEQGIGNVSSASIANAASLTATFPGTNFSGNTIIVVVGVGNATAPTVTDSQGNTYLRAANVANASALNISIFYAANCLSGSRNTISATNGGTSAAMAMRCYEVDGLLSIAPGAMDTFLTATGSSATAATAAVTPFAANNFAVAGIGLGTAAQTITPATGWNNDSGQLNPTSAVGLFSFISMSQYLPSNVAITPSATMTSEPWAIAVALFRPCLLGVAGTMHVSDGTNVVAVKAASTAAVAADPALVVGVSPNSMTAKGAQGSVALPVQELKDSGRQPITIWVDNQAGATVTTSTLFPTQTRVTGTGSTSSGTTFAVTTGKTFRITSFSMSVNGGTTTSTARVYLRSSFSTAATSASSPPIAVLGAAAPASTSGNAQMVFGDGYELAAGTTYGIANVSGATTCLVTVTITGFEY